MGPLRLTGPEPLCGRVRGVFRGREPCGRRRRAGGGRGDAARAGDAMRWDGGAAWVRARRDSQVAFCWLFPACVGQRRPERRRARRGAGRYTGRVPSPSGGRVGGRGAAGLRGGSRARLPADVAASGGVGGGGRAWLLNNTVTSTANKAIVLVYYKKCNA